MILSSENRFFLRAAVFLIAAIPITVIDLRSRRIPDILSLGALAILAAIDLFTEDRNLLSSAAAGLFSFLLFVLVRKLTGGLGFGDVKYAAQLGFFAGPRFLPLVFFVAASGGLAYSFVARSILKRQKDERIAFGPFLSAGGVAAVVCMVLKCSR